MLNHQITEHAALNVMPTEYVCRLSFDSYFPDEQAWRTKLLQLGLHPEAFSLASVPGGGFILKFWEPDRREALRILAKLDGMRALNA